MSVSDKEIAVFNTLLTDAIITFEQQRNAGLRGLALMYTRHQAHALSAIVKVVYGIHSIIESYWVSLCLRLALVYRYGKVPLETSNLFFCEDLV